MLCPWSKGCLFIFFLIKYLFINELHNEFLKINQNLIIYNAIFASSNLFHIVLFWYNQLNFLKFSLSICFEFKIRLFIWWINLCIKLYPK